LWFDPTQLPSFSGVVERYLINPEGKTDRLLFREGPQIIFPEHVADDMRRRPCRRGQSIVVYGIRARRAAAITMLAWAPNNDAPVRFVDRPAWTYPEFRAADERLEWRARSARRSSRPQGDPIGAILEDGTDHPRSGRGGRGARRPLEWRPAPRGRGTRRRAGRTGPCP
jgi:hypothetical protein